MEKSGEDVVLLDRASRATRGKRLTKLLDDEIEEDELFWNQDALKEEEEDDNYQEEPEIADEFDSDFDEDVFRNISFELFCAFFFLLLIFCNLHSHSTLSSGAGARGRRA